MKNVPVENVLAFMKAVKEAKRRGIDQKKEMRVECRNVFWKWKISPSSFPEYWRWIMHGLIWTGEKCTFCWGENGAGNQPS